MTENDKRIYRQLRGGDSMELLPGGQVSQSSGINAQINQIVGNPAFKAEVSLQIFVRYYSQAVVGTPAPVVPPAGQQTNLPCLGNIPVYDLFFNFLWNYTCHFIKLLNIVSCKINYYRI
jgi:hypothetical protein